MKAAPSPSGSTPPPAVSPPDAVPATGPAGTQPGMPPAPPLYERPRTLGALFWAFTVMALQGFGGVLAVVQREVVERRRWMGNEEFVEMWAVAQIMPGPNVVNFSIMFGDRCLGARGALAAMAGMLAFPLLVVLALALLYTHWAAHPAVAGALRGVGAVAAGLIAAVGIKLLAATRKNPLGRWLCGLLAALTLLAVGWWRLPIYAVLPVLGGLAWALAWRKLAP